MMRSYPLFGEGYITANGVRLYYVSTGEGKLIPFLYKHPYYVDSQLMLSVERRKPTFRLSNRACSSGDPCALMKP